MDERLVIDTGELEEVVGRRPFVALPREEIVRLYGAVASRTERGATAERSPSLLSLGTLTLLHRNYTWATFANATGRALALPGVCDPEQHCGIFLDEDLTLASRNSLEGVIPRDAYEVRLAGLLSQHLVEPQERWLRLVFVAQLHRPFEACRLAGAPPSVAMGSTELVQRQTELDPTSRLLVDNLTAF